MSIIEHIEDGLSVGMLHYEQKFTFKGRKMCTFSFKCVH